MESFLKKNFDLQAKIGGKIVKNPINKRILQGKIRVAFYVQKAALSFIEAANKAEYKLSEDARAAGFCISPDGLASISRAHDTKTLQRNGGVDGILRKVFVFPVHGVKTSDLSSRQKIYGLNQYVDRKPSRSFWMLVWDALQDLTLIILMVCAVLSIAVGLGTEGWPKAMYDGMGILLSIFLVVIVTAVSGYKQSLQFKDLDREGKKKILIRVTRDGYRQKVPIYDLVVGDIVHLSIGDEVPADGLYISGYSLLIDKSSLSGESEPVNISRVKPFLLAGTKVLDGSATMLVTAVGMRTEWGRLMETLSQGGEDETPLQVKLNGVATIIRKIGLAFGTSTFIALLARFLVDKAIHIGLLKWYPDDALTILNFAVSVRIIVVAVTEGLSLVVTFAIKLVLCSDNEDSKQTRIGNYGSTSSVNKETEKIKMGFSETLDNKDNDNCGTTSIGNKGIEKTRERSQDKNFEVIKVFSDFDIQTATNHLSETLKIGHGGYGSVYSCYLDNTEVAVKMLDANSEQGSDEFIQELEVLGQLRHPHLVNLIGACFKLRALVYEFLANGSLEDLLNKNPRLLTWRIRTRIVYEISLALNFLHSNKPQPWVHGDLKPSNILLDANFHIKLTDFGFCCCLTDGTTNVAFLQTQSIKGTDWYIDPDFLETGKLTTGCDFYSFGITILRIFTGRKAARIYGKVKRACGNKSLMEIVDCTAGPWPQDVAESLAHIGLECCKHDRESPQLMREISTKLVNILANI